MDTAVLFPILVTIVGIISYILILRQYRERPRSLKIWIHFFLLGFIGWGFFTFLVRIAPNEITALIFLKIATIMIVINYLAQYVFNVPFVNETTDSPFYHYILLALFGFNIYFILFSDFVNVYYDPITGYWFDNISEDAYIFLLLLGGWGGIWVIRGMIATQFFSSFYKPSGKSKHISPQILIGILIFITAYIVLQMTLESSVSSVGAKDSTGFILFAIMAGAFYGYIYGIRPLSSVLAGQKIWGVVVIDPAGIPIAIKSYSDEFDFYLFSSGILVFDTLLKHQVAPKSSLKSVIMKDKVVLTNSVNDHIIALISQKENIQSTIILEEVTKGLKKEINFENMKKIDKKNIPAVLDKTMKSILEVVNS